MTAHLIYFNGHDALDDAAWYLDGTLIGREEQVSVDYDVLPQVSGKFLHFEVRYVRTDADTTAFFWKDNLADMAEWEADDGGRF